MSDNVIELNTFTAAQYWEAQADMWHANYADAQKENEKLREENDAWRMDGASCSEEVKRLRAENEKLRTALKPFARAVGDYRISAPDHYTVDGDQFTLGQLRRAAAALKETGDE